jgi:hypothetical protein
MVGLEELRELELVAGGEISIPDGLDVWITLSFVQCAGVVGLEDQATSVRSEERQTSVANDETFVGGRGVYPTTFDRNALRYRVTATIPLPMEDAGSTSVSR